MLTALADDTQPLTDDWLDETLQVDMFSWRIEGTQWIVHHHEDSRRVGLYTIAQVADDGSEPPLCHIQTRGELRQMLALLGR